MERITLKNIKYSEWNSEETHNFYGEIYFDKKKVGYCTNEGHGGNTYCIWNSIEDKPKYNEMIEYCKTLPPIVVEGMFGHESFEIDSNIENICDKLFEDWLQKKEDKKMEKNFNKGICFGNDTQYQITTFHLGGKSITISELIKTQKGIDHLKTTCEEKKKQGHKILNTNLPFEV